MYRKLPKMSEPAFLLTSDESAIVMREHEGRWYAVRIARGQYGSFEFLNIRADLSWQRAEYLREKSTVNYGPFSTLLEPEYLYPAFLNARPSLSDVLKVVHCE